MLHWRSVSLGFQPHSSLFLSACQVSLLGGPVYTSNSTPIKQWSVSIPSLHTSQAGLPLMLSLLTDGTSSTQSFESEIFLHLFPSSVQSTDNLKPLTVSFLLLPFIVSYLHQWSAPDFLKFKIHTEHLGILLSCSRSRVGPVILHF